MKINGYYINLEHRKDRNKHFIDNIKKYDFFSEIKRYEAVYNKDCGAIGCVKSHINVLELCLQQNDNYYLIMEDDFSIFHEKNLRKFIDSFTNIKNKNWDVITLTPCGDTINCDTIKDYCRIKNNLATSGYIIKKDKINILLDSFKESLKLLIETGDVKRYILDRHWFKIQDKIKFYYFKELFGTQLNGFSDIKNDYTSNRDKLFINNDYKKLLINEYLINLINEPYDDINNFKLAYEYEELGQTGAALSYYLRCAEYTSNDDLSYECFLRLSKCLSKQGHREFKELTCLEHAISIRPDRSEAYYIMSLYHSFRGNWLKSYMYACIGLKCIDLLNNNEKKLIKEIGYFHKYQLLFQKAYAGYNKGKLKESQKIYYDLLENYELDDNLKNIIMDNLTNYKTPNSQPIIYTKDKYDLLKYKFTFSENIKENYSQIYQDLFVLSMTDGKMRGNYLEIGSGDPIYGNNTYLLEENYNWSGISIDINQESYRIFNEKRRNKCICKDATKIDYKTLLKDYTEIDYLQLDCDPPVITYLILLKIPFDRVKFGVITYEHDYYSDVTESYREKSRDYLKKLGYKMVVGNISPNKENNPFEDWWIHPDLIDESIYNKFIYKDIEYINGEDYMFYSDLNGEVFEIDENICKLNNYHNNETVNFKLYKKCNVCDCIRRGFRWEEHQHDIIDKYLTKDSICIEAGAHIGTISVKLSKVCKKVYCFESVINTYNLLKYNMKNNCNHNYELFNKGLGESCKIEHINWISDEGSGGIGLTNNIYSINKNKIGNKIEVVTIDSLNLDKLDYIKIDVEGYEENIVNGGINTIKNCKPIIVLECYETFEPLVEANINFVKQKYKSLLEIGYSVEHLWKADFLFTYSPKMKLTILPKITINKNLPELIVIDNFYKDPDSIRKRALDLEFLSEENHGAVGFRCERGRLLSDEAKDYFEKILGKKIKLGNNIGEWSYSTNGCFQWCNKDTRIVYHSDSQEYAGIVFLTPDAPVNCGTSIFRHKKYKIKDNSIWSKSDWSDGNIMNDPHLDKNLWEEVDRIGNIYNRLILFKSHNVHAVSEYFGETINDSRLFQLFFFDIE